MTAGRRPPWRRLAAAAALTVLLFGLVVVFFPWDWLRGPLGRYVSARTGRPFEITRHLDVSLGRSTRVTLDGLSFANPAWAEDRHLVQAERAEVVLRLWPLLGGRLEMDRVTLTRPRLGLQTQPDGRRTWSLEHDGGEGGLPVVLRTLTVDEGHLHYVARHQGADLRASFSMEPGSEMPLRFRAHGRWRDQPLVVEGRAGSVLALRAAPQQPLPLEVDATAGSSRLRARGTVSGLADFAGADLAITLEGRDLADLYPLAGLVLPATPPYAVQCQLRREGDAWRATRLRARLGRSDMAGHLTLDRPRDRPVARLAGELQSSHLDLDDLAPLAGVRYPPRLARERARRPDGRVLPRVPLDVPRLHAMEADVRFEAHRIVHTRALPLESLSARVRLEAGVLQLDPLAVGVAGGRLAGMLRLDAREPPPTLQVDLRGDDLQLARLLPVQPLNRASVGQLRGRIELTGRGRNLASMLGTASGEVSLLTGPGRISNLLLEYAGLDGAEILKFLVGHDQVVGLRCAAAGFAVKQGVMTARTLVLDTTDTVIWGGGHISLADERLDLTFLPRPKDMSILTLRSPLRVEGTLGQPRAGPDRGAVAARAGAALALGAINPLLGLAATLETGPGKDVDCPAVLRQASAPAQPPAASRGPMQGQGAAAAPAATGSGRP